MKFIHTADWHLGNSFHNIDRSGEAAQFLGWLRATIEAERAEALIIAGDVFDTVNPPVEARRAYFAFLAQLLGTPCRNVVIVGGNHDSAALLDAPRDILEPLNIHVVGSVADSAPDDLVFELTGADGAPCAVCAAVPFMREAELRRFAAGGDGTAGEGGADFCDNATRVVYAAVYAAAENLRAGRVLPLVATGHLYAADLEGRSAGSAADGEKPDDGTRRIDVMGNLGAVHSSAFPLAPAGFDYVALGHIHYTTTVAGNERIRYSGSPFVLGFDEANIPRHVLSVEVGAGAVPSVEKIRVPQAFSFVRIEGAADEIRAEIARLTARGAGEKPMFAEIRYEFVGGENIHEQLADGLKRAPFEVVSWKPRRTAAVSAADVYEGVGAVQELSEEEIFQRLMLEKENIPADSDDAKQLFEEYMPLFLEIARKIDG